MFTELFLFVALILTLCMIWIDRRHNAAERRKLSDVPLMELNGPLRLPFIGSALYWFYVGLRHNLFDTVHEFCSKYGSIMGIWAGSHYFIFVEDPVIGKEILNADNLSRKFPATSITYKLYGPKNLGISQAFGHVCKEMRRFSIRNLKRFGFGNANMMNDIVQLEIQEYLNNFEASRLQNGGIIHMNESFYLATLNVLWRLMTGAPFKQDDERLNHLVHLEREILKQDPIGASLPHAFHWLTYIPGITPIKEAKEFWTEIRALLGEILVQRRKLGEFRENPSNFIDAFLHEIESANDSLYTDEQCVQTCMDLFVAGLDSTAHTLDWLILYLISYPEVYAKVMQEVDSVIGTERLPTIQDKAYMPYTEAVMLEVMRIANVVTYTMRAPLHETSFKGYHIPANTHIVIKLACFHTSKEIWGDPENFRPERFLADDQTTIINTDKIFTFGYGKRVCIGENSSKMSIFLFLTTLLQKYKLDKSPKHSSPSLVQNRGILVSHPDPFYMMATKRVPNEVA